MPPKRRRPAKAAAVSGKSKKKPAAKPPAKPAGQNVAKPVSQNEMQQRFIVDWAKLMLQYKMNLSFVPLSDEEITSLEEIVRRNTAK